MQLSCLLCTVTDRPERIHPELVGRRARARLVVLAGEIGGRWSDETNTFVRLLAEAKVRGDALLACSAVRAFATSLLDLRPGGADGQVPPVHEVVQDFRRAGLVA